MHENLSYSFPTSKTSLIICLKESKTLLGVLIIYFYFLRFLVRIQNPRDETIAENTTKRRVDMQILPTAEHIFSAIS